MSQTISKRTHPNKTELKLNFKHCNIKSSNCSIECVKQFLNIDNKNNHKPYPIFRGLTDTSKQNALFDLVEKKKEHLRKIAMIRRKYVTYQKNKQTSNIYSSYETMQDLFENEPDKYFCSNYNWYYTGGNLIVTKISSSDILLHAASSTELGFSKIKKKKSKWTCTKKRILCNLNSEIYQLDSTIDSIKTIIGVRLKNDICLYDVDTGNNNDIVCKLRHKLNSDVPMVSMSFNHQSNAEYACANANQCLAIWDLRTSKRLCYFDIPFNLEDLEKDCFGQIAYSSLNELIYINRNDFCLIDKRSNFLSNPFTINYDEILEYNDRFVNVKPFANNLCYISTFGDILILDLRNKKVINKSSHNFTSAPFISSNYNSDNENCFCISSCKSEEKIIWKNKNDTYNIPFLLPTVTDSYESNLLKATNMNAYRNTKNRVEANTTGMYIWPSADNAVNIFSCNILGDVFCHEINENSSDVRETNDDFKILCNSSNNEAIEKLEYMDKVVLDNIDLKVDYEPLNLPSVIKNKRLQDCIVDLKKRKKGYSAKITDVWDNVDQERILDDMKVIPIDVSVRNWLKYMHPEGSISEKE